MVGSRKFKKLFCTGEGTSFKYAMALNKEEATTLLENTAVRNPDSDDMRRIWTENALHEKNSDEIQALFGISRQALSLWRQKAGADIPRFRDHTALQTREFVRANLDLNKSVSEQARILRVDPRVVREVAAEENIKLPNKTRKKPDDATIVTLAEGRTWKELAAACNVSVHTLQHYVYARKELAAKVRPRLAHEISGAHAHGKIDRDRLVEMYRKGHSAYGIAKEMGVQTMTAIYWLKKLGIYRPEMG